MYYISLPAGNGINLQFLDFDIDPGTDTNFHFDYLEVSDDIRLGIYRFRL